MLRIASVCLLLTALSALAGGKDGKPAKDELPADLEGLLKLLNESRAKEKLGALSIDPKLAKAARAHNDNMCKQEKMAHVLDEKGVGARVTATGYDYRVVAENLAQAKGEQGDPAPKPAEIHKMWMDSKGHRANMLNGKFTQIGLAMGQSKKGTYYYTQVFATPRE